MFRTTNECYRTHSTQVQSTSGWNSVHLPRSNCSSILCRVTWTTGISNSMCFSKGIISPWFLSTSSANLASETPHYVLFYCLYVQGKAVHGEKQNTSSENHFALMIASSSIISFIQSSHIRLRKQVVKNIAVILLNLAAICLKTHCNYEK